MSLKTEGSSEAVLSLADTAKAAKEMARLATPTKRSKTSSQPVTPAATTTMVGGRETEPAKERK